MPNLYFYAYGRDIIPIIEAALEIEGCRVFEACSAYEEYLKELRSPEDLESYLFADAESDEWSAGCHLAIWPSQANNDIRIHSYALNPKYCDGKTWRQRIIGWGVIFLHAGYMQRNSLCCSTVGVNSEARALKWQAVSADKMGPVAAWNWPLVRKTYRRLGYVIGNNLAVNKVKGRPVLPEALQLLDRKRIKVLAL